MISLPSVHSYMETNGAHTVVKPWVWIGFMFLGPVVGTISLQWFFRISVRIHPIVSHEMN